MPVRFDLVASTPAEGRKASEGGRNCVQRGVGERPLLIVEYDREGDSRQAVADFTVGIDVRTSKGSPSR